MPNPRSGTMVQPQDLPRAIQEAKGGRTEYRTDRTAIIHCAIGKISFETNMLLGNLAALTDAITRDRPAALKGQYSVRPIFPPAWAPACQWIWLLSKPCARKISLLI